MQSKWKRWLAAVAAILIVFALVRALGSPKKQVVGPAHPETVVAQTVAKIKKAPTLDLTGSIEAVQEAVISTQVSGQVAAVQVQNGETVTPGQPLVLVDDSSYRDALAIDQANLESAQAALESARQNYQRIRGLFDSNFVSAKDLEDAKVAQATAEANADSAVATVSGAQDSLQDTSICSPISGVAADCDIEVGQYLTPGVSPGVSLLNVEDIDSVYADVNIEQGDLPAVKPGLAAEVTADAYGGHVFDGTVEQINPVGDIISRVFATKIRVANSDHLLRPGMFVKVEITTGAPVDVIAVPQNAVVSSAGLYYVFLVDGDRVKRQQVQVGQVIGENVEITSGLAEGQQVVLTDVSTLNDGDQVIISQ
jgi:RND family efflux transporter MFP subunit